jgi:putative ABC transport system permease protein
VWNKHCPGFPFEYGFLEETIARMYSDEQRLGKIFIYFSFLAINISCLGLFGLSSFMSEQRTKEIGVRKVVGASVFSIVQLLTLKFTKWVLFANIIGWPIAYFVMDQWLRNFYYRTDIGIYEFVLPGLLVLIIALVTVSYQSIRAALANPVEALRYE